MLDGEAPSSVAGRLTGFDAQDSRSYRSRRMQDGTNTFVIVESRPLDTPPPPAIRSVEIREADVHGGKPDKARPDEVDEVIRSIPPDGVEVFRMGSVIGRPIQLRRLPPIDRFKNLKNVEFRAGTLQDLSPLFALEHLKILEITACPLTNLSPLRTRRLDSVRLIRGKITHFDLSARSVLLQACSHLVSFAGAEITNLDLESCNKVDLSTLASVRGLIDLRLVASGPVAANFDFLAGCSTLRRLTISTPLGKTDFSALGQAPAVKFAYFAARNSALKRIALDCPDILVSNGNVCYRGQQELPGQYFFEAEREDIYQHRAALA